MRWLHISDIHERKRDQYFREQTYARIVKEVGKRHPPDAVFLTGDMAFSGLEAEYRSLEAAFVEPLRSALPRGCPIFTIPGNHDVDRNRGSNPRIWFNEASEARLFQGLDDAGAQLRRDKLFPRFEAYAAFEHRVSVWGGSNWLESERGSVHWSEEIGGARITIVGVNTAWLCHGDDDAGKLTPGRYMLEAALGDAAETAPDLLIVLGHHPLDALIAGGDDSDGKRVRTLLKRHNALYLHGDLHAGDSERFGDDTNNTLAIQAPAAFQAVDDRRWRNGLMWGEADVQGGWIMLEPQVWNDAHSEFKFDGDAGHNKFRHKSGDREVFRLHLPGRTPLEAEPDDNIAVPPGWLKIDQEELARIKAQLPSADMMANFFDGDIPSWPLALAPGIKPRVVAERLATNLRAAFAAANQPRVQLLVSAGSGGKSTALIHAAAAVLGDQQQHWTCFYRQTSQPLPEKWLAQLPRIPDHAWLVVIDEADSIAPNIRAEVERIAERGDIHLLLAARDAEWQVREIADSAWERFCNFVRMSLSGLDEVDARRIVGAWSHWSGEEKATAEAEKAAVASLLRHARDAAARNEGGELLGALLLTRTGEHLKTRVTRLLEGFGDQPQIGKPRRSLRYLYALIAAMHAENQLYLSRFVLAHAVGCEVEELDEALRVLRRETRLLDAGGTYVLTRHRVIAQAACDVLRDDPAFRLNALYPILARSAREVFLAKSQRMDEDIKLWNYQLAANFVKKGELWWPVAQAVAKAIHEAEPTNRFLLTDYAKVLRETNRVPEAMEVLKAKAPYVKGRDRVFLYDWSTVAGMADHHALGVWLGGRSLADGERGEMDERRCELSLAGLSIAFNQLHRASDEKPAQARFVRAEAACGQLGLRLHRISKQSRDSLERAADHGRRNGVATLTTDEARKAIYHGVVVGTEQLDLDEFNHFEKLIGNPDAYKYSGLIEMLAGQSTKVAGDLTRDGLEKAPSRRSTPERKI